MIRSVSIDTTPMHPGDSRSVTVWSDATFSVAIKCWVFDPPPPGFKPCDACGEFLKIGDISFKIVAPFSVFRSSPGELRIAVSDMTGYLREFRIPVTP